MESRHIHRYKKSHKTTIQKINIGGTKKRDGNGKWRVDQEKGKEKERDRMVGIYIDR
jgi:hypothetical protein